MTAKIRFDDDHVVTLVLDLDNNSVYLTVKVEDVVYEKTVTLGLE